MTNRNLWGKIFLTDAVSITQVPKPFLVSLKHLKNYCIIHKFNDNKAVPSVVAYKGINTTVSFKK